MIKNLTSKNPALIVYLLVLLFAAASCKKDNSVTKTTTSTATPVKIGLDEYYLVPDSTTYKILGITIQTIGTKTIDEDFIFDTGSGGLVIDGNELLPANMITSTGFNFTGDSTVSNGITITNQTDKVVYGDDNSTTNTVYGNLAYASVKIGQLDGTITIKRLPFFIYCKVVDSKNNVLSEKEGEGLGEFDVFGSSTVYDISFANNVNLQSPFYYYDQGTGLTKGFRMAALGTSHFSDNGTYVPDVVTLGLTSADLSSSGFATNTFSIINDAGYVPLVPGTVTYNGKDVTTSLFFDTGTEPYSIIEDKTGPNSEYLASGASVSIATTSGFNFSYTVTGSEYLTQVENPNVSGSDTSIFGLEFFLQNSYLLDYTDHVMGIKNN